MLFYILFGYLMVHYLSKIEIEWITFIRKNLVLSFILFVQMWFYMSFNYINIHETITGNYFLTNRKIPLIPYEKHANMYQMELKEYSLAGAIEVLGNKDSYFYKYLIKR